MSFEIPPLGGPGRTPPEPRRAGAASGGAFAGELRAATDAGAPPAELTEQVRMAARRYDELAAQGRTVRFDVAAPGRVRVEVHDDAGRVVETLGAGEAVEVALGRPVR